MVYNDGIHPESGKEFSVNQDIIITPFWTDEYCKYLVEFAQINADRFSKDIEYLDVSEKNLGWYDLKLDFIDQEFFYPYINHVSRDISPILKKVYTSAIGDIKGWFFPYIIKYTERSQRTDIHHDASMITLNIKLNNDYSGCELFFPRQKFNNSCVPIGHAVIWPSTVTHPHGASELVDGEKFSFVSWSWPPEWQKQGASI
jgi:hypothetical protein